ncbi:MAG: IPT/TIG domain-containing protein [Acidobacteria bacterium]|nr:IPT/TIG domain-containing protein [Acidobacteriota bacterium]
MRRWKAVLILLFFIIFGLLEKTSANSGNPPLGSTGAPGEQSCSSCHNSFPTNSGKGQVAITGLPREYVAGMTYDLTVFLADTESSRWGFELTILDSKGVSVGNLVSSDETFAVVRSMQVGSGSRDYLVPTIAGNFTGRIDVAMWQFKWTAPSQDAGNITFHLIGVACDGDATARGDDVYTNVYNIKLFEPKPPILNFVNPPRGSSTGGTKVTLGGQNYRPGVKVFFDDIDTKAELVNELTLSLMTPPHDIGLIDIRITNSDGMTTLFPRAFEYITPPPQGPTVNFASPDRGPTTGGTSLKISGNNFQRGAKVFLGNKELPTTFIDINFLMVTTPLRNPGPVNVLVINPDGQIAELADAFTYEGAVPPPVAKITSVENIVSAGGAPTTIKWTIDSNGTPFQRLLLSTDGGSSFPIVLASRLTATTNQFNWLASADLVTERARIRLEVIQPEATVIDETTRDFKIVPAPRIDLITPSTAKADKTKLPVEIRGQGFTQGTIVEMDGVALNLKLSISSTLIKVKKFPHITPGYHFVRLRNPNGGTSRTFLFTIAQ